MLQTRVSQTHYVSVSKYSEGNVNSLFEFAGINEIVMLESHLNSRPR